LTAADVVLLAASEITVSAAKEFSEWELSVAAWKRDPNRFGMRGFEQVHPDHKRVMKEIMGRTGAVQRGLLEKPRPNFYSLTALGRSEAVRLGVMREANGAQVRSVSELYDDITRFTKHRVFLAWLKDPAEPATWLGASAFLGLKNHDASELKVRLSTPRRLAADGLAWCNKNGRDQVTRGPVGGGKPITRHEIQKLLDFVDVLETRFAAQVRAILKRGERSDTE